MVRTRFAPSPTGYLHVGGARTALYSWLYARKHGGQFILRIEDTDIQRSTQESVKGILDGMEWLGLTYDEGPFYQTERFDRYEAVIKQLLDDGKAYRCYCSKERLEKLREEQTTKKEKPRYDRFCREKTPTDLDQPFVIRFHNPEEGEVIIDDQVFGRIVFNNYELDDLILARMDGTPTYNFTVIVDDMDMQITHVIRGDDHINNTPRQVNILKALGVTPPTYAHVPMILGEDGKRLSKRHGAVGVMNYHDEGFLPEALLNYLVRLGWSHGDQEIFSLEEMIEFFDMRDINRAPAAFNTEKLLWLNQHYLKTCSTNYVAQHLVWHMQNVGVDIEKGPSLEEIVKLQRERSKTLAEMAQKSIYFYQNISGYDEQAVKKNFKPEILAPMQTVRSQLAQLQDWTKEKIHEVIIKIAESYQIKLGNIAQPIRVAISGGTVSPPVDETLVVLGKDITLERLDQAIAYIRDLLSANNLDY